MGLFGKKKESQSIINLPDNFTDEEKKMVQRLCSYAPNIIAMLKSVLSEKNGTDMYVVLLYAAGLAGIACYEAASSQGKEMVIVECKNGKKYYMGDSINQYLHENKMSVSMFVMTVTNSSKESLLEIIKNQASTIGSDSFVIENNIKPEDLYINVKKCWDGIKNNMTLEYCKNPDEWPVLYGIVLQNVILESMKFVSKETLFNTSINVACALSKIGEGSL